MLIKDLIDQAKAQAAIDHFSSITTRVLFQHWHSFQRCCHNQGIFEFSEDIAIKYCENRYGASKVTRNIDANKRAGINAISKLIELSKMSEFKISCRRVEKRFSGKLGEIFEEYLLHLENKNYKPGTIIKTRTELYEFYQFLKGSKTSIAKINKQTPEKFIGSLVNASQNKKYFLLGKVTANARHLLQATLPGFTNHR